MVQLRCTGKVQKELGIKPNELSEIKEPDSTLENWYVNMSIIDKRKIFLFVNERTILSFILYGVKKSNISHLHEIFVKALNRLLLMEGINYPVIDKINHEYNYLEYTKTNSRSMLGNMNNLMFIYKYFIYSEGGLNHCNLDDIIQRVNRIPQKNIEWGYSIDLVKDLLQLKFAT